MTSHSPDDVEEQMRQRRLREEARREKHIRESSADNNKMDVDVDPRISELERSINARKEKISRIQAQIDELQQEYRAEVAQCQKEEDDLKQLQGVGNDEERNDWNNTQTNEPMQSDNNENNESNANNQNQQVMTDEELARHLAAQFEREEQEQHSYLNERTITEPRTISQYRTIHFGNQGPGSDGGNVSFQFSSSELPSGSLLESFFGNDDFLTSGDSFRSLRGFPLFGASTRQRPDPFSQFRILPMGGVPGQMFGGALMGDNMDYETLLRLFPPVPRGAQASDIEQLPVDTFRPKSNEEEQTKTNENESKEDAKKEEAKDEFHRCCICLENFKEGDEIRRLPCLHIFHTAEIDEWLIRNHLCPICRTPIEQNEPQQRP